MTTPKDLAERPHRTPKRGEVGRLMKRCQIGVGGRNALDNAHSIMADCYGTLGLLMLCVERYLAENVELRAEIAALRERTENEEWMRRARIEDIRDLTAENLALRAQLGQVTHGQE